MRMKYTYPSGVLYILSPTPFLPIAAIASSACLPHCGNKSNSSSDNKVKIFHVPIQSIPQEVRPFLLFNIMKCQNKALNRMKYVSPCGA